MSILVKKEIHLLRPVWLAVLVLEVALPWFSSDPSVVLGMAPVALFLGMILLAIEPFGREFSLGTFSSLMSQPMERRQVWQTKIKVLFLGAALIFAAYFVSCELRLHSALLENGVVDWRVAAGLPIIWRNSLFASVAVWFLALVGGLWTVLLLRQIATAFWITLLAPLGILMTVALCLPAKYVDNDHVMIPLLYGLGALYTVAGFWLARRLFHQAQDAAWTGGVISFSTWRYFRANTRTEATTRHWQPISALLKKEFQLHSISLFCALSLLVLHLLVFLLRITYVNFHRSSVAAGISDLFWGLWLVMPFIIGGTAVAEERKLGLTETQFCLPVSRRKQFALKFGSVMIFGTLLGGVLPMLLESLAAWMHLPNDTFSQRHYLAGQNGWAGVIPFEAGIVALAAGLSWVSFFASTLARNFLQALSLTIVLLVVAGCLAGSLFDSAQPASILGLLPWPSVPPILFGVPTLAITVMWLQYGNFNWFHEGWRLWRRNLLGMLAALGFVLLGSTLLYHRVWEVFQPAEPAHGPAKFSPVHRPALRGDFFDNLLVQLPDGRMWFDSLSYSFLMDKPANRWKLFWRMLGDPRPSSAGPQQFLAGANWVSATAVRVDPTWNSYFLNGSGQALGYLDTVGIRADGTLWISSRAEPNVWTGAEMTQFGDETNWQQVVRQYGGSFLLLKNNGTLWRWGTNQLDWSQWQSHWPTVRNNPPHQVGTNSDWREIFGGWYANARKTDSSSWIVSLDFKTGRDKVERQTDAEPIPAHTFACESDHETACVAEDGTLWFSNRHAREDGQRWEGKGFLQISRDTNWVAVAITWPALVALKADGSLWKWKPAQKSTEEFAKTLPTRLGIHDDWMALKQIGTGLVTLAADGSLWLWSNDDPRPIIAAAEAAGISGQCFQRGKVQASGGDED